jgi:hypothetical protein
VALTLITVTGTFRKETGEPATGTVRFTLSSFLRDPATDTIVAATPVLVPLDEEGSFSTPLTANDDPGVLPVGSHYTVRESVGVKRTYNIIVSRAAPGGTVDLADLAP